MWSLVKVDTATRRHYIWPCLTFDVGQRPFDFGRNQVVHFLVLVDNEAGDFLAIVGADLGHQLIDVDAAFPESLDILLVVHDEPELADGVLAHRLGQSVVLDCHRVYAVGLVRGCRKQV